MDNPGIDAQRRRNSKITRRHINLLRPDCRLPRLLWLLLIIDNWTDLYVPLAPISTAQLASLSTSRHRMPCLWPVNRKPAGEGRNRRWKLTQHTS